MDELKKDPIDMLKYSSTETVYQGIIVEVTDASVTIDIKGRLGEMKLPKRMVISEYELQIGQEVGFLMSYPEVLHKEPNIKYVNAISSYKESQLRIKRESELRKAEQKNLVKSLEEYNEIDTI